MKRNFRSGILSILLASTGVLAFTLVGSKSLILDAQQPSFTTGCNLADVVGTYATTVEGKDTSGTEFVGVGFSTIDAAGNLSVSQIENTGGFTAPTTLTGTVTVNQDCTFTASATNELGFVSNVTGVVVTKKGKVTEILLIGTNLGFMATVVNRRVD